MLLFGISMWLLCGISVLIVVLIENVLLFCSGMYLCVFLLCMICSRCLCSCVVIVLKLLFYEF